jgi:hypothetical protein
VGLWAAQLLVRRKNHELEDTETPQRALGAEDTRKIHLEINQIVNQRFLLITAAITLFGVVITQMIPKDMSNVRQYIGLMRIEVVLLLIFLLVFFRFSLLLRRSLRLFATYLIVKKASAWEADWEKFRVTGVRVYTHAHTDIFLLLGFLTTALPIAIAWNARILNKGRFGLFIQLIAGALYLILVWGAGRRHWFQSRENLAERWRQAITQSDSQDIIP